MFDELKQGFFIGLAVSVPVGPIALLIVRRSVLDGRLAGIVSGLGAATADLICGVAIAIGLTAIMLAIEHHAVSLRLIGGFFLIGMGIHTIMAKTDFETRRPVHERNLWTAYWTTGLLTIANPLTFMGLTFVSAAAGVGTGKLFPLNTGLLALGISAGSGTWWMTLSCSAAWLGRKLGERTLQVINQIAGAVIIAVGIFQISELIGTYLRRP